MPIINHVEAVFFDVGGTLISTSPPVEDVFLEACSELGLHIPRKKLKGAILEADEEFRGMMPSSVDEERDFFSAYNKRILEILGFDATMEQGSYISDVFDARWSLEKFPEVDSVLEALKGRGFRLALISNAVPSTRERIEMLGIDRYLDAMILSSEVGSSKPQPEIFLRALESLGVDAARSVHVGDDYEMDILGAKSVGIVPILVDREGRYEGKDCIRISSLEEILTLI